MGGYNPNAPSEFHQLNVTPRGGQGVNIEANPAFSFGNTPQQQNPKGVNQFASSLGGYLGKQSNYTPNQNTSDPLNTSVGGYSSLSQAQQAAPYASGYIQDPQYGYIPVASAAGNTNT